MNLSPAQVAARKKGGFVSQLKRHLHPELYTNCNLPRNFRAPKIDGDLAELVGAILGDGGITVGQLKITLNSLKDVSYSKYLMSLMRRVLGGEPYLYRRKKEHAVSIIISGVNLVRELVDLGLKIGNKVKMQVGVPDWITKNMEYSKRCVRGLMDTDGGVFKHRYYVKGKRYCYLKICFTNKSQPLRDFVSSTLTKLGIRAIQYSDRRVWIYGIGAVFTYMELIGTSNERLLRQFE